MPCYNITMFTKDFFKFLLGFLCILILSFFALYVSSQYFVDASLL